MKIIPVVVRQQTTPPPPSPSTAVSSDGDVVMAAATGVDEEPIPATPLAQALEEIDLMIELEDSDAGPGERAVASSGASENAGLLCRVREFFCEPHGPFAMAVLLVMPLLRGGDLVSAMAVRERAFSEDEARSLFCGLMVCLERSSRAGIAHRDVKLENVMLAEPTECFHRGVRLVDFGLAARCPHGRGGGLTTPTGTPSYIAPEIIRTARKAAISGVDSQQGYGVECDVWSAGVVLYILLSGSMPFFGGTMAELLQRIAEGSPSFSGAAWAAVSPEAVDMVRRCLTVDPAKRITPSQAITSHPWLRAA